MGSGQGKMASPGVFELEAELESLQRRLRRLRAIISDAEKMQGEGEVFALWLREIKDIACDAEDLIDEFEYEELRRQIEGNGSSGGLASSLSQEAMIHKMKEVRQKMHDILDEKNALRFGDASGLGDQEGTQTNGMQAGSLLKGGEVLGREREEEEIIEFLLTSDDEVTPSTIAITGMGGLGKTTLAQLVYNDSRVEEHFHLKMWVCVAAGYDVVKVTREILGSTGYDMQRLWGLENLDVYQRMLVDKLKGQRFLLVIDNLWRQDCRKWQTILAPLIYGDKGNKVLITTRDQQVARNLQATKTVELGGLQFYDCWRLFVKHALPHGNFEEHPRLEAIGLQIVDKFKDEALSTACRKESKMDQYIEEKRETQKRSAPPFQRQDKKKAVVH
ncbi:hypothetical protein Taro_043297 [Colocasia esculenta]|uniref:Uncharacterized protein n=1 Tax=Colocasia esculenta TaxID=4460 RepID=A0A843X181_COLES|nr:hypothetical protein [Colocasia esculenta]